MLVLHVDDDPITRELIKISLGRYGGHTVLSFADTEAALASLRQADVDLILSDVMMPGRDGARFIEIARDEGLSTAPVIFLTSGYDIANSALEALHPLAILNKPFDPIALPDQIRRLMEARVSPTPAPATPRTDHSTAARR